VVYVDYCCGWLVHGIHGWYGRIRSEACLGIVEACLLLV